MRRGGVRGPAFSLRCSQGSFLTLAFPKIPLSSDILAWKLQSGERTKMITGYTGWGVGRSLICQACTPSLLLLPRRFSLYQHWCHSPQGNQSHTRWFLMEWISFQSTPSLLPQQQFLDKQHRALQSQNGTICTLPASADLTYSYKHYLDNFFVLRGSICIFRCKTSSANICRHSYWGVQHHS